MMRVRPEVAGEAVNGLVVCPGAEGIKIGYNDPRVVDVDAADELLRIDPR